MDKQQFNLMKEEKEYHFDKYLYHLQSKCFSKLKTINRLSFNSKYREKLLKRLFNSYGENNIIKNGFKCNFGFNITVGNNCYFNYNVTILDSAKVIIGNNVFIAPNVIISPVTHPLDASHRRDLITGKIIIEDDVWIGANSVILPDVTIHKGAVIGANSLVKNDVGEYDVVCGNPAKVVKKAR